MKPVLRRSLIAVAVLGAAAATAIWWLGREATLQALVQKVADASGGNVAVSGVSGSLYGSMHFGQIRFHGESSTVTIDNADVSWSPLQLFSGGIEISTMRAATVTVEARPSKEPGHLPDSLAPPFRVAIGEARVARLLVATGERRDEFTSLRLSLRGDAQQWQMKEASGATPWGALAGNGKVDVNPPFKVDARVALDGLKGQQLRVNASGSLANLLIAADGKGYGATGTASMALAPFEQAPLRRMTAQLALPENLKLDAIAALDAQQHLTGSIKLVNPALPGPIDKKQLPFHSATAALGGTLSAIELSDLLIDLAQAGTIKGSGSLAPASGSARLALHAERINLKALHSSLRATHVGGDINLTGNDKTQSLVVQLAQDGLHLAAHASVAGGQLQLDRARLQAGSSTVDLTGSATLGGPFKARATLQHLNPAAFGDFPEADINARANVAGLLRDAWQLSADFALDTSRVGKHPLSGSGSFLLDARHASKVNAVLALAKNSIEIKGSFGAPGEELSWRVDANQPQLMSGDLTGALPPV